jgi:hypothetical protein
LKDTLTREELDQEIDRAIAGTDPAMARLFRELAVCACELRVLRDCEKRRLELLPPDELQEKSF